jgi:hypothetical protein
MTFYEAAVQILRSSREPLTIEEITERALARGLIVSRGKTPQATMATVLYRRLGTDPQLVKIGDRAKWRAKRGTVRWTLRKHETTPAERLDGSDGGGVSDASGLP